MDLKWISKLRTIVVVLEAPACETEHGAADLRIANLRNVRGKHGIPQYFRSVRSPG
jgi:hypothetical protein